MAAIDRIVVTVKTGTMSGAGTDGRVYLGACGREFRLASAADDFEIGSEKTFVLGKNANVTNPGLNDPRAPQLDTDDASNYPVYIRFEVKTKADRWNVHVVCVRVEPDSTIDMNPDDIHEFGTPMKNKSLWMGY